MGGLPFGIGALVEIDGLPSEGAIAPYKRHLDSIALGNAENTNVLASWSGEIAVDVG